MGDKSTPFGGNVNERTKTEVYKKKKKKTLSTFINYAVDLITCEMYGYTTCPHTF